MRLVRRGGKYGGVDTTCRQMRAEYTTRARNSRDIIFSRFFRSQNKQAERCGSPFSSIPIPPMFRISFEYLLNYAHPHARIFSHQE